MSLEANLTASIVSRLTGVTGLRPADGVSVVSSAADDAVVNPRVVVSVTRGPVSIPGYAVYACQVEFMVRANAWAAASANKSTTGNQSVESLFSLVEASMTGELSTLSTESLAVFGAEFDGAVSDEREDRIITRTWSLTVQASPL